MSQYSNNQVITMKAGETLSAQRVVACSGANHTVLHHQTSSSAIFGVTSDSANSDQAVSVIVSGTARVKTGGDVTVGDVVAPLSAGNGVVTTIGTHNTSTSAVPPMLGVALESGLNGSVIEVLLQPCNQVLR
jgi:Uncharacterized conserved protein (DUF2190)